jgi:caa(3)-type oxidase subunit IV
MSSAEGQTHPISIYLKIWALLFVFSFFSYMVDYYHVEGYLRWFLILLFMMVKASLIVAFFMHLKWERLALRFALLAPPIAILVFVALMFYESDYTFATRSIFFDGGV